MLSRLDICVCLYVHMCTRTCICLWMCICQTIPSIARVLSVPVTIMASLSAISALCIVRLRARPYTVGYLSIACMCLRLFVYSALLRLLRLMLSLYTVAGDAQSTCCPGSMMGDGSAYVWKTLAAIFGNGFGTTMGCRQQQQPFCTVRLCVGAHIVFFLFLMRCMLVFGIARVFVLLRCFVLVASCSPYYRKHEAHNAAVVLEP